MYRVMPVDPLPDGNYNHKCMAAVPDDIVKDGPYEIVFKVPRLEAHVQEGQGHYTIVLPTYVAEEMRAQAEQKETGDQSRDARSASKKPAANKKSQVYLSYVSEDQASTNIATFIKKMILDEYDVASIMLEPEDGRLNYIDFDDQMKDCTHFIACMVPLYLEHLEKQQGRPYLELKAAATALPSQKIVCVYPDNVNPPSPQRIQLLSPMELRKAFVSKAQVFYSRLGHMDAFETCLSRFLGIEHMSDLMQLPMSASLEAAGLGNFIRPLYTKLECTSVGNLAVLENENLAGVGMDRFQAAKFFQAVEQEILCLLLEANGVSHDIWRRLVARHAKEMQAVSSDKQTQELDSHISFSYTCNLTEVAVKELCKGDAVRAQDVSAVLAKLRSLDPSLRADAVRSSHFPEQEQSVKTLVAKLWTPDVSRTMRAEAAELIRRKSLNPSGLEEIRHIAGLESLIKLVEEGLPAEKIAALWTLKNFGLVELYRSRMASMGVISLCVGILEDMQQPVSVHHAAAAVLQVATTADIENVKILSETNILSRLVASLWVKHRALKVAAIGTLSNMVILDCNKVACSRLRAVPRLVTLLSAAAPPPVATQSIGAVAELVRNDENRLKSWRCGAVEKLKVHVHAAVPHVSTVAAEAIQVLMAGPRIHPKERFLTASGRRLAAKQMREAIQRLNTQHTYLIGLKTGTASFEAAAPQCVAALTKRPVSAGACLLSTTAYSSSTSALDLTRISRQDFETRRPATATTDWMSALLNESASGDRTNLGLGKKGQASIAYSSATSSIANSARMHREAVPTIDPQNCTSDFMRKLTLKQQIESVDRLTYNKKRPTISAQNQNRLGRSLTRTMSLWERPMENPVKPKNANVESRRKSGKHMNALASVKYRTVTGKTISADRIEKSSRRMSTGGNQL